ncbi:small, acid-soluble spore protein L [Lederbergia graminis]|uniref:Small, acid-soluble spore protein L n=1 Tax=Lederbergia graminis TaxID=735518 RepID=A0ABW0LQD9_9BACI|nr:small, acid-soluble spore protein L [Paenibacillus bovis]HLU22474.1 small, acid-soluble spore protein L [Bacillaceae bacterium]
MAKSKKSVRARNYSSNKGNAATSVNPQGIADTEFSVEPKSKLENAAKKKNTK